MIKERERTFVKRRDINVDYHAESGTWGIRMYDTNWRPGFVAWGAASPEDCKNLPYYYYPLEEYDD